ncbi:ATP-binding protein [Paenibacillus nitricinens]|uniref:ATP-binding protein n=1 Tax=Paenibacillus nitricinens TaxID=3367691 RepID=UPI003F83F01A
MNNILLDELFYALTLAALPFIIHYFYDHCFPRLWESKVILYSVYTAYYIFVLLLHNSPLPGLWMLGLNIVGIVLLSFLYKGKIQWRIGAALFIVALIILSDAATAPVYTTSGYIFTLFLSKILMFILVQITLRFTKAFGEGSLSSWYWIGLFCFPFISILSIAKLSGELSLREYPALYPALSGGMLLINFLIILLCDRVLTIQSAQNKNYLLEQQNTYYMNQYLLTKERQQEVFTFQHDFRNILLALRSQLQAGEKEAGLNDVDKLLGVIELSSGESNTGSILIDSIINYKSQFAKKLGISFQTDIKIPPQLDLDAYAFSIILGNTLDNAIEACKHPGVTQPYIKFQLHYHKDTLFIRIQNPYQHSIRTNHFGELATTKRDKHFHGIGLKSVKNAVEEIGGIWDITYENQIFQVEICLFNIEILSVAETEQKCTS